MLLIYGFKINFSEPSLFFNPLSIAVAAFDDETSLEILEILFANSKDIDINQVDRLENSALHYSCIVKKPLTAKFLLENGADPELRNGFNYIPMDYCKDQD